MSCLARIIQVFVRHFHCGNCFSGAFGRGKHVLGEGNRRNIFDHRAECIGKGIADGVWVASQAYNQAGVFIVPLEKSTANGM